MDLYRRKDTLCAAEIKSVAIIEDKYTVELATGETLEIYFDMLMSKLKPITGSFCVKTGIRQFYICESKYWNDHFILES